MVMKMKKALFASAVVAALAFAVLDGWTAWGAPALVPVPRQMKLTGGEYVAETMWTGEIPIRETVDASLCSEGYRLVVSSGGVSVASADAAGSFYARQTLSQLSSVSNGTVKCPCVEIEDFPAFRWRGLLLDESRHFFGMDSVKRFLDLMSLHKLNVFHWHLTDDQGWRIQIDRYPELTTVASRRPYSKSHKYILDSVPEGAPGEYGPFFYTKAQIREIVAFAAERHIRVVPEIEIPGHSRAVLKAFPDLLCFAGDPSQKPTNAVDNVYCAGNDRAIRFLEGVLDEVCEIFPEPVLHIGGDEVNTASWEACPKCRARMEAVGAKTPEQLQAWMNGHFANYVAKKGKRPIWWGENSEGEIPSGLAVMSWRGPDCGVAAAKKGHEVVMCAYQWTYFCHAAAEPDDPAKYPYYSNRRTPASKVYRYDPLVGIPPEFHKYVMGGEGCNWTEYTNSEEDLDWKCWTRAAALSEVFWTAPKVRDLGEFLPRLSAHVERLRKLGVNSSPAGR